MPLVDVLGSAAINAALIAALAFLARSIVVHWLDKDIAQYKATLDASTQRSLEEYRALLTKQTREHEVRFTGMHQRRAEAIERLYVGLVNARYSMEYLVSTWSAKNEAAFHTVMVEINVLHMELSRLRIHLPEALADDVEKAIRVLTLPAVSAGVWPKVDNPEHMAKANAAFGEAQAAIQDGGPVSTTILQLERAFREALGGVG